MSLFISYVPDESTGEALMADFVSTEPYDVSYVSAEARNYSC